MNQRSLDGSAGLSWTAEADRTLYSRLEETCFKGPEYDFFVEALVSYAYPVLRRWIASGEVVAQLARLRKPIEPLRDYPHLPDVDIEELVQDTLVAGLKLFTDRARAGTGWSAGRGASLSTYFLGACLLEFPGTYRRWRRVHKKNVEIATAEPPDSLAPDPADLVIQEQQIREILGGLSEPTRLVLTLAAAGYSHAEIAEILDTTPRAVEGRLYRARKSFTATKDERPR